MANLIQDLTAPTHECFRQTAQRTADSLRNAATITDGIIRWDSNNSVPPTDCLELAAHLGLAIDLDACIKARATETAAALDSYRRNRPEPSGEELAEMRMNFEPGTTVVNVITGRKTRI